MKLFNLSVNQLNQNGYSKNMQTKGKIGALFAFPINHTPDDCLSCDGYSLLIVDYKDLYNLLGTYFNQANDPEGTFRIPDYNITGRFLQPGTGVGNQIIAGLPNITGALMADGINSATNNGIIWGATGAFYLGDATSPVATYNAATTRNVRHVLFSASNSSPIYGSSNTVQPPSQIIHICIKYK